MLRVTGYAMRNMELRKKRKTWKGRVGCGVNKRKREHKRLAHGGRWSSPRLSYRHIYVIIINFEFHVLASTCTQWNIPNN